MAFRIVHNKIKVVIGKAIFNHALSCKWPKDVWQVIHRVLNPSPRPICADPDELNKYFINITENFRHCTRQFL